VTIKRCKLLALQLREERAVDLESLLSGVPRVVARNRWVALAAHRDGEVEVGVDEIELLGAVTTLHGVERSELEARFGAAAVERLLSERLLWDSNAEALDEPAILDDWHPLSAVAHRHSRWSGVDTGAAAERLSSGGQSLAEALGESPPTVAPPVAAGPMLALPAVEHGALAALCRKRVTCRNFDLARALPLPALARVLAGTYGAIGDTALSGVHVVKKAVASAGGLHAIEPYVIAQRVEGLDCGLYHYHGIEHSLTPVRRLPLDSLQALLRDALAGQFWFEDCPAFVVHVARFGRNFWKYRRHAKAVRALTLDSGHLSHQQYLAATECGLAAFVTAAINDCALETALELDPMQHGVMAISGFGYRGDSMQNLEFDPNTVAWPNWAAEAAGLD
jgi:putative peptide maturation dehydrogenase